MRSVIKIYVLDCVPVISSEKKKNRFAKIIDRCVVNTSNTGEDLLEQARTLYREIAEKHPANSPITVDIYTDRKIIKRAKNFK